MGEFSDALRLCTQVNMLMQMEKQLHNPLNVILNLLSTEPALSSFYRHNDQFWITVYSLWGIKIGIIICI